MILADQNLANLLETLFGLKKRSYLDSKNVFSGRQNVGTAIAQGNEPPGSTSANYIIRLPV